VGKGGLYEAEVEVKVEGRFDVLLILNLLQAVGLFQHPD
jgi:hypothetical protein